ncbi:MAG: hypothetical protein ABI624_06635 [Casimicrobiaceae bacterium]
MTQPDLFTPFTRSGSSIVPPTAEQRALQRADEGIARATAHAKHVDRDWLDRAEGYVRLHALVHREFLTEDVRAMAEADGLVQAGDHRAWGGVMRRAKDAGIIKANGYAPAKTSNLAPKTKWLSLVCEGATA